MGYYKQQEIAAQVEQADRVPPPRAGVTHAVFFPERRLRRSAERRNREQAATALFVISFAIFTFVSGVVLGVIL